MSINMSYAFFSMQISGDIGNMLLWDQHATNNWSL